VRPWGKVSRGRGSQIIGWTIPQSNYYIVTFFIENSHYLRLILPRDAMHSVAYAIVRCLSVRPIVRLSITFVYCFEKAKHILKCFALLQ